MTTVSITPARAGSGWRIWGHDHAVTTLQSAVRNGVRHAYILSGFHHVGKQALALEFARALVCQQPEAPGLPCGNCPACRRVGRGTHPDVTLYDLERQQQEAGKGNTSKNLSLNIDTVRAITSSVSLRPMETAHRVVIVDDVETMQETAQEAFLKTLEEPPSYATIVLLTTDAELMLETIRSRATTIQLQTVLPGSIESMLTASGVGDEAAATIARAASGRPGWAIQAANDPAMLEQRLELQSTVVSWIQSNQFQRMTEATRLGDAFSKDRASVYARLSVVQTIWRAAVLQSLGVQETVESASTLEMASPVPVQGAVAALRSVERCLNDLDANVRPRLALQSMVLQWPTLET